MPTGPGTGAWEPAPSGLGAGCQGLGTVYADGALAGGSCRFPGPLPCARLTPDPVPATQPEAPAYALPCRHCQLRSGKAGRGAKRRKVGPGKDPRNAAPARTRGLALSAPLRRFCSHCASIGGAWKRQEPRFARLAGRRDGGAGAASCPPRAQLDRSVPHSSSPSPETPVPKRQGNRSSPEAPAGDPKQLAKESARGGGAGGGQAGPAVPASGGPWLPEPLRGHPPAAGTYLDPLLRLGESRLGGRLGLQGLKSFQTESGTSHLRSPASARAPGRRDEVGSLRSRRRSALPAPSRRRAPRALSPPLPAPPRRRSPRGAASRPEDTAAAAPCAARLGRAASRERARRRLEAPPLPTSPAAPPPPGVLGGRGCQLPPKNNREGAPGVSLPAHSGTGRGTGPRGARGWTGRTWETRERGARLPREPAQPEPGGGRA